MNVKIRSVLLGRGSIAKLSYNHQREVLAVIVDGYDTLMFYRLAGSDCTEIFSTDSKPAGRRTVLSWSPDGCTLAIGSTCLELWSLEESLKPLKTYSEDFIDIRLLAWSGDSRSLAYAGSSRNHTVKVRRIEQENGFVQGGLQQIALNSEISALKYDPFGKYLLILLRNNILEIYHSLNCHKLKEVPLHPQASMHRSVCTVKELRSLDWSPDFKSLVIPSLDDSKIPLAVCLSRVKDFKSERVFSGHIAPISAVKFNPKIFRQGHETVYIVAMGDTSGAVSIWKLGQPTPLLLADTESSSLQVIEDLQWNKAGNILMVNVLKKYIYLYQFDLQQFGQEIGNKEMQTLVTEMFGAQNASQICEMQLEIFRANEGQNLKRCLEVMDIPLTPLRVINLKDSVQQKPIEVSGTNGFYTPFNSSTGYTKIHDQKDTIGKNNRKKIQPALMIRNKEVAINGNSESINQTHTELCFSLNKRLSLAPLLMPRSRIYKVGKLYLELSQFQGRSILQMMESTMDREPIRRYNFQSILQALYLSSHYIYTLCDSKLFILNHDLTLAELPLLVGLVHKMAVNNSGDVYILNTSGLIRGFNHEKMKVYTQAPVLLQEILSKELLQPQQVAAQEFHVEDMRIGLNSCVHFVISAEFEPKQEYFYNFQLNQWVSLELNSGVIREGYSIKQTQSDLDLQKQFFKDMLPTARTSEANLIYYSKHCPDFQQYKLHLAALLRELKKQGKESEMREIIMRHMEEKKYIERYSRSDADAKQTLFSIIKSVGGSVAEEFPFFKNP